MRTRWVTALERGTSTWNATVGFKLGSSVYLPHTYPNRFLYEQTVTSCFQPTHQIENVAFKSIPTYKTHKANGIVKQLCLKDGPSVIRVPLLSFLKTMSKLLSPYGL
jgi:hypothetical protein